MSAPTHETRKPLLRTAIACLLAIALGSISVSAHANGPLRASRASRPSRISAGISALRRTLVGRSSGSNGLRRSFRALDASETLTEAESLRTQAREARSADRPRRAYARAIEAAHALEAHGMKRASDGDMAASGGEQARMHLVDSAESYFSAAGQMLDAADDARVLNRTEDQVRATQEARRLSLRAMLNARSGGDPALALSALEQAAAADVSLGRIRRDSPEESIRHFDRAIEALELARQQGSQRASTFLTQVRRQRSEVARSR